MNQTFQQSPKSASFDQVLKMAATLALSLTILAQLIDRKLLGSGSACSTD